MITQISALKKYAKENKWLLLHDVRRKEYDNECIWILPNGKIIIVSYFVDGLINQINDNLNMFKRST